VAKKKKIPDMFIRGVPVEVRSEINAYREEHDLKLRDFLELAINTLKKEQPKDDQGAGLFEAEKTAKIIERRLQVYERLAKLLTRIRDLNNPIGLMETGLDASTKSRMLVDLQNMKAKLMEEMDSLLPEGKIEEVSPSEQELQPNGFDGEQAVQEFKARLRDSGFDLDAQLNKPSRKTLESKGEKSIAEENPIDAFLRAGQEEDEPMAFGEMATPERKAEVERIGKELEKRRKKKSS
jgi:hypothetical protein